MTTTSTDHRERLAIVQPLRCRPSRRYDHRLSRREHQVLARIAAGRSNAGIAADLVISVGAVEKHVANIFIKLRLPPSARDHRRVLAALWYVRTHGHWPGADANSLDQAIDPAC